RLAALLSTSTGLALTLIRDLSWGQWHAKEAPLLPQLERRKLLLWDREREVVAKFVGFGATGHLKARLARDLAGMKMAPTYRGFAHGFLLLNWEGASILDPRDPAARQVVLDAAPGYYAHLRRTYPAEIAVEFDDLAQTVEEISEAWLGDGHGDLVRRQAGMAAGADACALLGDQRPEPAEWAVRGASVVKVDAADHFLDHSWARNQDIAFDLAGFIEQWALTTVERARLLDSYVSRSADPGVHARLPFFHAVFAAHRLATLDTAYHAGVVGHAGAVDTERQRMGQALMAALTQRTAAACD
ncbi:MAG TPA: hypothetical protein VNL71_21510, partial [Chloroflexota bacterium]|nr:hypothetical protein [Chloroflexota bacterium]